MRTVRSVSHLRARGCFLPSMHWGILPRWGVLPSQHALRHPSQMGGASFPACTDADPPPLWTDTRLWKHNLRNFVADGKNGDFDGTCKRAYCWGSLPLFWVSWGSPSSSSGRSVLLSYSGSASGLTELCSADTRTTPTPKQSENIVSYSGSASWLTELLILGQPRLLNNQKRTIQFLVWSTVKRSILFNTRLRFIHIVLYNYLRILILKFQATTWESWYWSFKLHHLYYDLELITISVGWSRTDWIMVPTFLDWQNSLTFPVFFFSIFQYFFYCFVF